MKADLRAVLQDVTALYEILRRAKKKYISLSKVAGELVLTAEESVDARKIGCKVGRTGGLKMKELDRAIRDTILQRGLVEILEEIDRAPITTRLDANADLVRAEAFYLSTLRSAPATVEGHERLERWLHADWKYLRQEAIRDGAVTDALLVVKALDALPEQDEPDMLASFSARLTSNAHTFDPDRTAGRLLLRALCVIYPDLGISGALSSADREEVLAEAGILIDDVSSDVLLVGLTATSLTLQAAVAEWLPIRLPLYAIDRLEGLRPAHGNTVHAVENPTVFRILMERSLTLSSQVRPALICTSGHFSLAVQRLVEKLARGDTRIRYAGDFDLRGVEIALVLINSHPVAVELWRMSATDHAQALRRADAGPPLNDSEQKRLRRRSTQYAEMLSQGTAHQETIVDLLWSDVEDEARLLMANALRES